MNTTQHTPGPWTVNSCGFIGTAQKSDNDTSWTLIACPPYFHDETKYVKVPSTDTQAANARLIAAAPELLAACQSLLRFAELTGWGDLALAGSGNEQRDTISIQTMELARKAVAQATGKP